MWCLASLLPLQGLRSGIVAATNDSVGCKASLNTGVRNQTPGIMSPFICIQTSSNVQSTIKHKLFREKNQDSYLFLSHYINMACHGDPDYANPEQNWPATVSHWIGNINVPTYPSSRNLLTCRSVLTGFDNTLRVTTTLLGELSIGNLSGKFLPEETDRATHIHSIRVNS